MSNVGLDIGRWHGTQWQPIARLSGAEKAMVVAALSAALSQAGNKLVIIDEFSVIDDNWKPRFLENLKTAKEKGLIEQAIILDNRLVKSEGWENIELKA
jgi:DNA repair exonuclease SbcCD ATPase subunit